MATESQTYSLAYVLADGAIMAEHGSVTVNRATNSQAVNTVAKGYAGESPGAPTIEIQVTCAVPAVGFEKNFGAHMAALKQVEIGVMAAGQVLTRKVFVISDSFKHSVNNESAYDFTARGPMADWE